MTFVDRSTFISQLLTERKYESVVSISPLLPQKTISEGKSTKLLEIIQF